MARTKQTARKATGGRPPRRVNGDWIADNPELNDEEAKKLKEIEDGDMKAELKHIDKKYTEQGQTYFAETIEEEIPDQVNWWSKYALCLVRHMDGSNKHVQKISLQINSQHLKDILKETISEFPGVSFQTKDITIDAPYRVLYHYKDELEQVSQKLREELETTDEKKAQSMDGEGLPSDQNKDGLPAKQDSEEACEHLDLLLDFIHEQFKETIEEADNLKEQGLMSYEHLWTIFRPGSTVYSPVHGQPRAFALINYAYSCDPAGLQLTLKFVDFDGENFGTRNTARLIPAFAGAQSISALAAFPLYCHQDPATLRTQLIDRGRSMEHHAGIHFRSYTGIALEPTSCGMDRYSVDGRVVVDTKTFHRLNANFAFSAQPFPSSGRQAKKVQSNRWDFDDEYEEYADDATNDLVPDVKLDLEPLTDEQCIIASATVRGFSFTEKRWFEFFVDKLAPAGWVQDCFQQLVLPSAQKDLVQALVANHTQQTHEFDDIVKGKGKGLIMVLHGPPGVGKTLTAETVAEYCKRPLYMVSSGDLGTDVHTLDERLSRILDMASTWRAVLLIDEADVFLERRSLHDMERNGLVSIFLRVLEYYEGILFLTSNRVATFDDAFKSRIHVPLKYNNLTIDSREKIWRNFLHKMDGATAEVSDGDLKKLAQADINGRQIKNVIRTAKSLAEFKGSKLDLGLLEQVVGIQMEFEEDLMGHAEGKEGEVVVNGH